MGHDLAIAIIDWWYYDLPWGWRVAVVVLVVFGFGLASLFGVGGRHAKE